jgi:hypothetical protein
MFMCGNICSMCVHAYACVCAHGRVCVCVRVCVVAKLLTSKGRCVSMVVCIICLHVWGVCLHHMCSLIFRIYFNTYWCYYLYVLVHV